MKEFQEKINGPFMNQVDLFEIEADSLATDSPAKIKILGVRPK